MEYIIEPEKKIEVCNETDICVIGGSCTGVFAAVRAARLGASVTIVEKSNCFGGIAGNGLVCAWHTFKDFDGNRDVIAGLSREIIARLKLTNSVEEVGRRNLYYSFNSDELKIELDRLISENKIKAYLHTYYASAIYENNEITAIITENKDGRKAIRAKFFIDASGDGDLARDLGINRYYSKAPQPPTACFHMSGAITHPDLCKLVHEHGNEFGLDDDWGWSMPYIAHKDLSMRADNHVFGVMCDRADDLTYAETEGRRQMRAFISLLNKYADSAQRYRLIHACAQIGIRETSHIETAFKATEMSLLLGERYEDAILNGTYRVDIHHARDNGITFKELNGEANVHYGKGTKNETYNWREQMGLSGDYPQYYQVPFRMLVNTGYKNFIAAGRMMNADDGAFGALRVMVNINQMGEAAGVAAYYSVKDKTAVKDLDGKIIRETLNRGGSLI